MAGCRARKRAAAEEEKRKKEEEERVPASMMEHDKKKEKKAVEEKETPPCKYGYQGQFNRVLLLEPMQYSGTPFSMSLFPLWDSNPDLWL